MNLRALSLAATAAMFLAFGDLRAQTLDARLDRNPIHDNETVRLVVTANAQADGVRPDLAPLRRDFEVLGQSTSTHVAIENGARSVRTEWIVELAPRRSGRLVIGPLRVGTMTSPALDVEVLPAPTTEAQSARDVFLEVEATPRDAYVQSQVLCVLRIYRAAEFLDAKLSEFAPEGAVTHRLGKDSTYGTVVDGRRYRVIERRFAVFPQASGQLVLPAFRLDARIADAGAASTIGRLFGEGRRVRLSTQPVEVEVKPRPTAAPTPWLPATAVTLTEEWPKEPPRLVAGEPVTWTLRLGAAGLAGEQLPPIEPAGLEGVRFYPDQPVVATRAGPQSIHGELVQRIALVPGAEGTLAIPELRVQWWDVEADAPRTAAIPARTIAVAASPIRAETPRPALSAPVEVPSADARLWQRISAVLAVVWLATLGALLFALGRRRRGGVRTPPPAEDSIRNIAAARRRVLDACRDASPRAARGALLAWAGLVWTESPPRDLIALAARVRDEPLAEALLALDRALWSACDTGWTGQTLAARLPREFRPRRESSRRRHTAERLPSLHPA